MARGGAQVAIPGDKLGMGCQDSIIGKDIGRTAAVFEDPPIPVAIGNLLLIQFWYDVDVCVIEHFLQ